MLCSEDAGTSLTSRRCRRGWSVRGQQASIRAFLSPLTVLPSPCDRLSRITFYSTLDEHLMQCSVARPITGGGHNLLLRIKLQHVSNRSEPDQ